LSYEISRYFHDWDIVANNLGVNGEKEGRYCMKEMMNWFRNEESGQGMVEYGLILALVALAAVLVLTGLGTKIAGIFTSATDKIPAST